MPARQLVGTFLILFACDALAIDASHHPRLYVSNEATGDVSVIDTVTNAVVATVKIGQRPRGIQRSPDGRFVYVAVSGSAPQGPNAKAGGAAPKKDDKSQDGIGAIDTATNRVLPRLPGGSDPEQFAVGKDGHKLYVSDEDDAKVAIVDVNRRRVLSKIGVGKEPEGVSVSPDARWIYVTCEGSDSVAVLDAVTGKVAKEIRTKDGARPRAVAFLPDSSYAYISLEQAGAVGIVKLPEHQLVKMLSLGDPVLKPMGMVASRDGSQVFVTTGRGAKLLRINTKTQAVDGQVAVGERPWGVVLSEDDKTLYTANGPSDDISVVDVASFKETSRIKVGKRPWGLVLVP